MFATEMYRIKLIVKLDANGKTVARYFLGSTWSRTRRAARGYGSG